MKIAIVHELLTMRGGAERVLRILADMYPDAPIYTLLYDEKKLGDWFPKERIRTPKSPTPHALLPTPYRYNHHLYLNKFSTMIESLDFSEFDLVLSTSSAFAHGIITNGSPKHLSYIHAPARYLWDRTHDVLEQAGKGLLGPLKRAYLEHTFHKLRIWDAESAARPDALLAASNNVQRRIELYWQRESNVVYPPIDDFWFEPSKTSPEERGREHSEYFLIVSTLVPYKRIDIAIEACNQLGVHLKIVGEGPDRKRLEGLSGSTVEFYGYRQRDELQDLMTDAKALLFPGIEDFGLTPLESMACGTPVIAYHGGGALETVVGGKTGAFFTELSADSLMQTMESFDANTFDADACKKRAANFSRNAFEKQIFEHVDQLMNT